MEFINSVHAANGIHHFQVHGKVKRHRIRAFRWKDWNADFKEDFWTCKRIIKDDCWVFNEG